MTLVEFLAPLTNHSQRDKCAAVLYFAARYQGEAAMTSTEVRTRLVRARLKNAKQMNVSDVLVKAGHLVDSPGVDEKGVRLWKLTSTGERHVRDLLGLPASQPEIEHDVSTLVALMPDIVDETVRSYVSEALECLRVGAIRAAVVFGWTGAIRMLQDECISAFTANAIEAAASKHDQKIRRLRTVDDFARVKDKIALLTFRELGMIDKGEWATLSECLDLRNRCGHPTKYKPGVKKASSFVEDIVSIVFSRS